MAGSKKTRSSFDNVQDWVSKNSYGGGYENKLYKHKGKTNVVAKVTPKRVVVAKPKRDILGDTIKDTTSRKQKLSVFTPLSK